MTNIPDGYAYVEGLGRDYAVAALAATEQAGKDPVLVRAVDGGFLIPAAAADHYTAPGATPAAPAVDDEPTEEWKNADIEAWANDHGIDLAGATKKADMLAAIKEGAH